MRNFIILLIVVIAGLGIWRYIAGRVDHTNPDAVATAFLAALKSENISKASTFWVPDSAAEWKKATEEKLDAMPSGSHGRFFEDLPGTPAFTSSRAAKAPTNEQTMSSGGFAIDLRQIDGKWYVCKAPL